MHFCSVQTETSSTDGKRTVAQKQKSTAAERHRQDPARPVPLLRMSGLFLRIRCADLAAVVNATSHLHYSSPYPTIYNKPCGTAPCTPQQLVHSLICAWQEYQLHHFAKCQDVSTMPFGKLPARPLCATGEDPQCRSWTAHPLEPGSAGQTQTST